MLRKVSTYLWMSFCYSSFVHSLRFSHIWFSCFLWQCSWNLQEPDWLNLQILPRNSAILLQLFYQQTCCCWWLPSCCPCRLGVHPRSRARASDFPFDLDRCWKHFLSGVELRLVCPSLAKVQTRLVTVVTAIGILGMAVMTLMHDSIGRVETVVAGVGIRMVELQDWYLKQYLDVVEKKKKN